MALYLIAFNDEWVPDLTLEELRERGTSGRALTEEMTAAGVFVFSDGGLDASTAVCSVDPSSGLPVFTDGPFAETKEHLGGFAVVDVPGDAEARYWACRIAVAVGWPQEVHRFPHRALPGEGSPAPEGWSGRGGDSAFYEVTFLESEAPHSAAVRCGIDVAARAGRQVIDRDVRQAGAQVVPRGAGAFTRTRGVHPGVGGQGQLAVGEH